MKTKQFIEAFTAIAAFMVSLAYTETNSIYAQEEQFIPGNGGGYIHTYFEDGQVQEYSYSSEVPIVKAENLPSSYDLRDEGFVTPVRNQGLEGMCHAFAAVGACESNILKQGFETDAETLDLSEGQLGYFLYTLQQDPTDPLFGDYLNAPNKGSSGGNGLLAAAGLAEGFGLEKEKYCRYEGFGSGYSEYSRYAGQYRLGTCDNISQVNDEESRSVIKSWLMESGGVSVAFYSQRSLYYDNGTSYSYYAENKSYYENANHAALIVGWDDDYSTENFSPNSRPSNSGAWLVKNSYGADLFDDGYFWISYEDPSMGSFCRYIVDKTSDYDDVYEYDGAGYITAYNFDAVANIFTAENDCTLTDVSFYIPSGNAAGAQYKVNVFRLDNENTSSPTDGKVISSAVGNAGYGRYIKVPLDTRAELKKGEQFSLVLSMYHKNPNYITYLPIEEKYAIRTDFSIECLADHGESYILTNGLWEDTSQTVGEKGPLGNIPLKAFAVMNDEYTPIMLNSAIKAAEDTALSNSLIESAVSEGKVLLEEGAGAASCRRAAGTILAQLEYVGAATYPAHIYDDLNVLIGDVDGNGSVDISDATECLYVYALRGSGQIYRMSRSEEIAMNAVPDNVIGLDDATMILQMYAENAAGIRK